MTTRTMYMLTLDGKPIVVWWTCGRPRRPIYRTVGQTGAPLYLYKRLATVARHVKIATAQGGLKPGSRYGYVRVEVPHV